MTQLMCILGALLVGYLCKRLPFTDKYLQRLLFFTIICLLLTMGYMFGSYANDILRDLLKVGYLVFCFVTALLISNCVVISLYFACFVRVVAPPVVPAPQAMQLVKYCYLGLKLIALVALGILAGYFLAKPLPYSSAVVNVLLIVMLFVIGHQLRQQGLRLTRILLNKHGVLICLLTVLSSLLGGYLCARYLQIDGHIGLVLSAGFGWYTLSGILTQQLVSEYYGTVAFFIDFMREITALLVIPLIGRISSAAAIGYSGATALDCSLPILKLNLGNHVLPIAITSGVLLTLISPVLIPLLAHGIS